MAPSPPSVLSVVCSFLSKKSRTTTTRANVFPSAFASFSSSSTRQNDLGKHLHKESELAGEASQRAYLRDLEQIHLKKRKLEHEREENEANVKREMMREMLLKEKKTNECTRGEGFEEGVDGVGWRGGVRDVLRDALRMMIKTTTLRAFYTLVFYT